MRQYCFCERCALERVVDNLKGIARPKHEYAQKVANKHCSLLALTYSLASAITAS